MTDDSDVKLWSLRAYIMVFLMIDGADPLTAQEAVASIALAHPEINWDEKRAFSQWESALAQGIHEMFSSDD